MYHGRILLMHIYDVPPYMVSYYEHQMSKQLGYFKVVLIICVQLSIEIVWKTLKLVNVVFVPIMTNAIFFVCENLKLSEC